MRAGVAMPPLIFTLMLASGLRCEWNQAQERWEPLTHSLV